MRLLVIDNYDSFTYNLVHFLGDLGAQSQVFRNDKITLDEIERLAPEAIVLSPGPATPNEAGICLALIDRFKDTTPILGVCLGHQAIGQAMGGDVVRAPELMHGKTSKINHTGKGLFAKGGGDLRGFLISGASREFLPAKARIDGSTILVSNPEVANPVAVRYNWAPFPDGNLYNADGLPASLFRSDDWASAAMPSSK